ncbi:MAG: hypothetical protein EAZ85_04115 [Bacteroidetes bacterium]|nr:MAG: hypothetical protein EAZ85_04115 [Bacteroidota bacterium]TAG90043.1 MAG: hypothetical protein EAZ20_05275 [Bacteroidota bacterium]
MKNSSFQAISRIKLNELNKHYQRLNTHYQNLEEQIKQVSSLSEKLKILYKELSTLSFGQHKIHPEVDNLDVVWAKIDAGIASDSFLQYWVNRLQKEISQGKQRLEAGLLFGLLLEESTFVSFEKEISASQEKAQQNWLTIWQTESNPDIVKLIDWFDKYTIHPKNIEKGIDAFLRTDFKYVDGFASPLFSPITNKEVENHLKAIISHQYQHRNIKKEAKQIVGDTAMITEIVGTLTIMLHNLKDWQWKNKDGSVKSIWTHKKWRPFHQTNLLDTLFLEILGVKWGIYLKNLIQNHIFEIKPYDYNINVKTYREKEDVFFLEMLPERYSVEYNQNGESYSSNADVEEETSMDRILGILHKEVVYFQTRYKNNLEEQLFITHIDIQDYFLTLSPEVLLEMLEWLGVKNEWLEFFRTYFEINYTINNQKIKPKRGIFLSSTISHVLADVLLEWLRPAITQEGGRILRLLDDIYLLAPSEKIAEIIWDKTNEFLKICDLKVNPEKTGAVQIKNNTETINNHIEQSSHYLTKFSNLPQWQFLSLNSNGKWEITTKKVNEHQKILIEQLKDKKNIFQIINAYNSNIKYFIRGLAPGMPFGETHFEAVNNTVSTFFAHLFGKNEGIFEYLREQIIQHFPHLKQAVMHLPEIWFFFPVTAGGLALRSPICDIAQFKKQQSNIVLPEIPDETGKTEREIENNWGYFYYNINSHIFKSNPPTSTVVMESLVKDFVSRGGEVKGSTQQNLSVYWKWLLYTYGHELLETFGTFRFLLTELIPLQAIYKNQEEGNGNTKHNRYNHDDLPF